VCTELGCKYLFFTKIFWKRIRRNLLFDYNWHETAIFTKYKHVILTWETVWSITHDSWVLLFPISDFILRKYENTWRYPTMDDFSSNVNKPLHWIHIYNSDNWCVRSGYLCQGVHRRWWSEQNFNIIRNQRFSNHIVTKTDPMELNKWHRHLNAVWQFPWCCVIFRGSEM
jgi:hypothetical protein